MINAYAYKKHIRKILIIFWVSIASLYVFSVLLALAGFVDTPSLVVNMVDLDQERNLPTLYTSVLLFITGTLLLTYIKLPKRLINKVTYFFAGLFFIYLGVDEFLVIHEHLAEPTRMLLGIGNGSPWYHAWVIPALFVIISLVILFWIMKGTNKHSLFQRQLVFLLILLAVGVISAEIIGTQIPYGTTAYKLGPVFVEEMFEIGMISYTLLFIVNNQKDLQKSR